MRLTITVVLLLTLFGLNAAEQKILEVKSTGLKDELKSELKVNAHRSTARALSLIFINSKKKKENYTVLDLKKGVVLKQLRGYDVVTIQSSDFVADRGGHFNVKYLKNALSNSYGNQELKIELSQDKWSVYHEGRAVRKLDFKIRKVIGIGPVGIKKIAISTN